MIPPTTKMQHAAKIVPRRPNGSEKDARKAPQKHPAVKSATTVPERASLLVWRKSCLKESEATTSAITPRSYLPTDTSVCSLCLLGLYWLVFVPEEERTNSGEATDEKLVDSGLHIYHTPGGLPHLNSGRALIPSREKMLQEYIGRCAYHNILTEYLRGRRWISMIARCMRIVDHHQRITRYPYLP